jgi:hypothetical protein
MEAFGFVRAAGAEIHPTDRVPADALWAFVLSHREYGTAMVWLSKAPPVGEFLRFGNGLTMAEGTAAMAAGAAITVLVPATFKNVLRDRKRLLRFLRMLMADDAVLAVDLASGMPWSRAGLDDELAHDADLDAQSLYVYHAVQGEDRRAYWIHSHGLAELGGFDFDILRPNQYAENSANDILRSLTFSMLGGQAKESTERLTLAIPDGEVRLVPAAEYMKHASKEDWALREMGPEPGDDHLSKRVVVCEPATNSKFRGDRPEPSRLLSQLADDSMMLAFDDASTELMAERARGTLGVLKSLMDEFAELPVTPMVKLGFDRAHSVHREHLWFTVESIGPDGIDCTCVNDPFDVPSLANGQRATHSLDRLTDWLIISPTGSITPRSTLPARLLREIPEQARRELIELKRQQG